MLNAYLESLCYFYDKYIQLLKIGGVVKKRVYEIAVSFRAAIESALKNGDINDSNMRSFPNGCCSYASDMLQKYLFEEKNISTYYVSGYYGFGWDAESHAWLEMSDNTVIDITGDQYKYNENIHFDKAVYVGKRKNGFHEKFVLDERVPYQYITETLMNGVRRQKIDAIYKSLLQYI